MQATAIAPTRKFLIPSPLALQQGVLVALLVVEIIVFSIIGTNFLSRRNLMQTLRLSVEIGLLAVALTPVIITGAIDVLVGSLVGLSAGLLGKVWRDGHLPIRGAGGAVIGLGFGAGAVHGRLVTP